LGNEKFVCFQSADNPLAMKIIACKETTGRDKKFQTKFEHKVTLSGFNSSTPQLLFKKRKAIGIAQIYEDSLLFSRLLTTSILKTLNKVSWLSCGFEHCLAVTKNGKVVSWGYGASGALGHGDYVSYTQPKMIASGGLQSKTIIYAECGGYHSGAITDDGQLYMWGRADAG
jgi:alpha-tubulin suppressor-like RCC1 family protein